MTYKNQAFHFWPLTFALAIQVCRPVIHKIQIFTLSWISKSTQISNIPIYLTLMEPNLNSSTTLLKVFDSKCYFCQCISKTYLYFSSILKVKYLWCIYEEVDQYLEKWFSWGINVLKNVLLEKWTNFWKNVSLEKTNNLWRNVLLEKWINSRQNVLLESCLIWILNELSKWLPWL